MILAQTATTGSPLVVAFFPNSSFCFILGDQEPSHNMKDVIGLTYKVDLDMNKVSSLRNGSTKAVQPG